MSGMERVDVGKLMNFENVEQLEFARQRVDLPLLLVAALLVLMVCLIHHHCRKMREELKEALAESRRGRNLYPRSAWESAEYEFEQQIAENRSA